MSAGEKLAGDALCSVGGITGPPSGAPACIPCGGPPGAAFQGVRMSGAGGLEPPGPITLAAIGDTCITGGGGEGGAGCGGCAANAALAADVPGRAPMGDGGGPYALARCEPAIAVDARGSTGPGAGLGAPAGAGAGDGSGAAGGSGAWAP
jgi:hypothetical protein